MKNYKVKIGNDIVVELTEAEIREVHDYYETEQVKQNKNKQIREGLSGQKTKANRKRGKSR